MKYVKIWFFLACIFPYKNRIVYYVLIREDTKVIKRYFWGITVEKGVVTIFENVESTLNLQQQLLYMGYDLHSWNLCILTKAHVSFSGVLSTDPVSLIDGQQFWKLKLFILNISRQCHWIAKGLSVQLLCMILGVFEEFDNRAGRSTRNTRNRNNGIIEILTPVQR